MLEEKLNEIKPELRQQRRKIVAKMRKLNNNITKIDCRLKRMKKSYSTHNPISKLYLDVGIAYNNAVLARNQYRMNGLTDEFLKICNEEKKLDAIISEYPVIGILPPEGTNNLVRFR